MKSESERSGSKIKTTRRETFTLKNHEQVYGRVTDVLGNGHFRCTCDDFVERICHIRGNMRNRVYVKKTDIVLIDLLVGLSGSDHKGIISALYSDESVRELVRLEEVTESFLNPQAGDESGSAIDFGFEFI